MKLLLFSLLATVAPAKGQIYADFTVSQGTTSLGTFRARLDPDKAPRTCANFIGLATGQRPWIKVITGQIMENRPYFDGLKFHRLIHNFVIQGGSPNGLGTDGPGYVIQDEYHGTLRHSGRYMLSMAKGSLPCTGGSQFFITLEAAAFLDDKHSVFGEVIDGKAIIDNFTNPALFPTSSEKPLTPITMDSVVISGPDLAAFDLQSPALMLPSVSGTSLTPSRNSAASTFTVTFNRGFQTEHLLSTSLNLESWTFSQRVRSRDAASGFAFTFPGVTSQRFFVSSARVDYGLLPNPAANLLPAGKQFALSDRSGNTLTLVSNGAGSGTWNHSNGGSGSLTSLAITDSTGTTGFVVESASNAHFFPLTRIVAGFNAPAGPGNWTAINVLASFHAPSSGWVEGSAQISGGPGATSVLQAFTITP